MIRWGWLVCASLSLLPVSGPALSAQGAGKSGPTPEAVLQSLAARYAGINDFTVRMTVVADIQEMNIPTMTLTMYFKRPDKIHIESEGLAIVPREAAGFAPDQLLARYIPEAMVNDTLGGHAVYRLTLLPRSEESRPRRLLVYVDPDRWTIENITSAGPGDRSVVTRFTYARADSFWMPSVVKVTFSSPTAAGPDQPSPDQPAPMGRRTPPRNGTVTITYADYRINSGLDDALFAPEAP